MSAAVIANALRTYLESLFGGEDRLFVRLEGFDEPVYEAFLETVGQQQSGLAGRSVILCTTAPVRGKEEFAIEAGKTATWYRNHVPPGSALILIINQITSDAQGLKDVFPVTETRLTSEGLRHLIGAAFQGGFALNLNQVSVLTEFIHRVRARLAEPQLRALSAFFLEINAMLSEGRAESMERAVAEALPKLRMFRCRELANHINTSRGDRLLRESYETARIGEQLLEDRTLAEYERRLKDANFTDERKQGGMGSQEKRAALRDFLLEVGGDDRALWIDWEEASAVLFRKARVSAPQKLKNLAEDIKGALAANGERVADLPDYGQEVVNSLDKSMRPNADDLERLGNEYQDRLGKAVSKRLRNLAGIKPRSTRNFIAELVTLCVETIGSSPESLNGSRTLHVRLAPNQFGEGEEYKREAAAAFRTLYGGMESVFPSVNFELSKLWDAADEYFQDTGEEEFEPRPADGKVEVTPIVFQLSVPGASETDGDLRAQLTWEYSSDGPAATTLEHVSMLAKQASRIPMVPMYEHRGGDDEFEDLDLSRPRRSFGRWYDHPLDLRHTFEATVGPRPGAQPKTIEAVAKAIDDLAEQTAAFVTDASRGGLLSADVYGLVDAYDDLLRIAAERLTNDQEAAFGFGVLNRAWTVRPRDQEDWVLVPLLHPLKLLWWINRATLLSETLQNAMERGGAIVDERRFGRELKRIYSSFNFPAVLSLSWEDTSDFYVSTEEQQGYELYLSSAATSTHNISSAVEEEGTAAQDAARHLARVIEDYVETYPFVKNGIEIYMVECHNGLLPGRLVEQLEAVQKRRGWKMRLSVLVHTPDRGAEIFRRVSDWLTENERFRVRPSESYFPQVTLKVLESPGHKAVFDTVEDKDVVILADVLSVDGRSITGELQDGTLEVPKEEFSPFPRSRPTPFGQGDLTRRQVLNAPGQPAPIRRFYNAQYANYSRHPVSDRKAARLYEVNSLEKRTKLLKKLHEHFNWVACYDTVADRFLLRHTLPGAVQVIRYSMSLGAAGRHNLTVSSAYRTQEIVVRRLRGRLHEMFPEIPGPRLSKLAETLVHQANELSGDIVLRAAGPGAYLNELIGLVSAKYLTERRYLQANPDALTAWIYLDDHSEWFSGKYPDLVFVAVSNETENEPKVHVEVIEAKCVTGGSCGNEGADAERQTIQGLRRLGPAWSADSDSGVGYLDAPYWRDQLIRAVAANLSIVGEQQRLWRSFQQGVDRGRYGLTLSGHARVFCHDGQGPLPAEKDSEERKSELPAVQELGHPVYVHTFAKRGLHKVLRNIIDEPVDMYSRGTPDREISPTRTSDLEPEPRSRAQYPEHPASSSQPAAEDTTPEELRHHERQESRPEIAAREAPQRGPEPHSERSAETSDRELEETHAEEDFGIDRAWLAERARDIDRVLYQYNIKAQDVDPALADIGPSIVRFKIRLKAGERLTRLQSIAEDAERELELESVPLIDNVAGSKYISIDLPRPVSETVPLMPLMKTLPEPSLGELPIVMGITPDGRTIVEDLSEFPHLLVGGQTNSGKSVFLRSLILCLMEQHRPEELSLLIVDPKRTDFSFFNMSAPYLLGDAVITDQAEARDALLNLVHEEMPRRQEIMSGRSFRVKDFNRRYPAEALRPIVAVIDEYAQLISIMRRGEREAFERDLMSLAAVARSTGIHLVLATQRPDAEVVSGRLKANLTAGTAFKVADAVNSRIVIDQNGAENLLGRGDMLFKRPSGEVLRLQAAFLDEEELYGHLSQLGES